MRKRKLYCEQVFAHFSQRFVKQYLLALQERPLRTQNISTTCNLKVGDLVLIKEDITPRLLWRRSVVNDLIHGHDDAVRGAIVRTRNKETQRDTYLKRPLQLLVSLEVDNIQNDSEQLEPEPATTKLRSKRLAALNA